MARRRRYQPRPNPAPTAPQENVESIRTRDSFANFAARLGVGANNQSSYGGYAFTPVTRNRIMLDNAYRGSWICRMAVKCVAEDMTREGVTLGSDMDPEIMDKMYTAFNKKFVIWDKLTEAIGWGRLYGGGGAVILIDGQDLSSPLRIDTIGKDQFCGLMPVDRWMIDVGVTETVTDLRSHDVGLPKYYTVIHDAAVFLRGKIHHTRFIRFEGDDLPYYQRISENMWGLSVLEPVFDRILAFDSATTGTAQLVYRAHLRTYGIDGLRQIIAKGGVMLDALYEQVEMMRMWQSNEGITLMDNKDKFETSQYSFAGLDAVLIQMGQQISGALQIPLVRLFGQSPVGLNSTGESDLRMYYDGVRTQQERRLRTPLEKLVRIIAKSEEVKLPENFNFEFVPLWQLTAEQKSTIAATTTQTILQGFEAGVVGRGTALKELRKVSSDTGIWTSITDEEVEEAENEPPQMPMGAEQPQGELPPAPAEPQPDSFLPGSNVVAMRPQSAIHGGTGADEVVSERADFLPDTTSDPQLTLELEAMDPTIHGPLFEITNRKDVHVHIEDKAHEAD